MLASPRQLNMISHLQSVVMNVNNIGKLLVNRRTGGSFLFNFLDKTSFNLEMNFN